MARKIEEVDITGIEAVSALAEEVQRTGEPKLLTKAGKDIAIITPAPARRRRKTGIITESDPLFSLVGIGRSGVPGGFSSRKYHALRERRRKQHEE